MLTVDIAGGGHGYWGWSSLSSMGWCWPPRRVVVTAVVESVVATWTWKSFGVL